jgi:hypothetical protein
MPQEGRGIQNPRGIPLGATEGPNVPCPRIAVPHHSVFPRTPGLYPRGVKTRFQIPPSKPAFFFTTFFSNFFPTFFFSQNLVWRLITSDLQRTPSQAAMAVVFGGVFCATLMLPFGTFHVDCCCEFVHLRVPNRSGRTAQSQGDRQACPRTVYHSSCCVFVSCLSIVTPILGVAVIPLHTLMSGSAPGGLVSHMGLPTPCGICH